MMVHGQKPIERYFEVEHGRRIHYACRPGGERTLVLVHGLGSRWQTFKRLIALFDVDWTVYALDQRGHGRSDWMEAGAGSKYLLSGFRDDLVAFVMRVVQHQACMYGHSLGGWVAALSAPELSEYVNFVGIEDSALFQPSMPQRMQMTDYVHPNIMMRAANPSLRQADPRLQERWTSRRAHHEQDPAHMLRVLRTPVLLVRGDVRSGGLLSEEHAERALSELEVPFRHVHVPEAPHAVHAKDPLAVHRAILECARMWGPVS